ncbi:MAG: HAD-IIA family hydrolase [Actinobacteria bacterium]|nr:HAD-IIA family hydrolase [Actinomycetota bacterium]
MAWVLDLDGVLWLGDDSIPGAAEAVGRLRAANEPLAFVTNNSLPTRSALEQKLARGGIEAGGDVVTSAMAVAGLVEPGERALLVGGHGVEEALQARGVEIVRAGDPHDVDVDAVVVGLNPEFDYRQMTAAMVAIGQGARLLATNDDATYPTPDGPIPGGGAILASIVTSSGARPRIAGKPEPPICRLVTAKLGTTGVCVGDRPDTDGRFARALGYRFVLVLSGVTAPADLPVDPEPDAVYRDLLSAVDDLLPD